MKTYFLREASIVSFLCTTGPRRQPKKEGKALVRKEGIGTFCFCKAENHGVAERPKERRKEVAMAYCLFIHS